MTDPQGFADAVRQRLEARGADPAQQGLKPGRLVLLHQQLLPPREVIQHNKD